MRHSGEIASAGTSVYKLVFSQLDFHEDMGPGDLGQPDPSPKKLSVPLTDFFFHGRLQLNPEKILTSLAWTVS